MVPDGTRIAAGTALVANPVWMAQLSVLWQGALSIAGAVVVGLTIYKLILEIKIRRQTLSSANEK